MIKKRILMIVLCLSFLNIPFYSSASQKEIDRYEIPITSQSRTNLIDQKQKIEQDVRKLLKKDISSNKKIGPVLNNFLRGKGNAYVPTTGPNRDKIRIMINTTGNKTPVYNAIRKYGARLLKSRDGLMALEVPADNIEGLVNETDAIESIRLPVKFFPSGEISEGVDLIGVNNFHGAGHNGAGVRIAVMDLGFKGLTEAYKNGDIPYGARTIDFTGKGLETEYYHGTACAEIIYDMAPGAEMYLLKISDEIDIYNAVDYCIDNEIDIISLSISTFGSGPGDGTGPLDEMFDEARENGILVVAAAGNFANISVDLDDDHIIETILGSHWEGAFHDTDNDGMHEFVQVGTNNEYNVIGAYPSQDDDGNPDTGEVSILLRWNDWPYADVDYDIYLYAYNYQNGTIDYNNLISYSNIIQSKSVKQPPIEYISIDLPDSEDYPHYYALVVEKKDGEPEGVEIELYLGGTSSFLPFKGPYSVIATSASSLSEPADAESVLAVGAINVNWKWNSGPQEDFSSQGPTNAWAGSSARIKPDICGPDGVTTYTYNTYEEGAFSGTSASAPHVAGLAALILSTDPDLTPDELQSIIESGAVDMGEEGKDNLYGWGRISTDNINLTILKSHQKISDTEGNFTGILDINDFFGSSVASIGDLDGDGVADLAVGAYGDDDGGDRKGAIWILFMNADVTVKSHQKISDTEGNFTGALDADDNFGSSVASIGDLDGDGVADLAVGAFRDDDGDDGKGAVWILFMNTDGKVKSHQKISDTEGNFTGALDANDFFGSSVASIGDLDGDGVADLAVGAFGDDDGGGYSKGAVWILFMNADGMVKSYQEISDTEGNFSGTLDDLDDFGKSVASVGDLDGDGVADLAVGAYGDDDGGDIKGAVWILFMNTDGNVKSYQKISDTEGNFNGTLDYSDFFGKSVASVGDLDGDGVADLAVGAYGDDDGGDIKGAVWILFMNTDGTVKSYQKISDTEGNFNGSLDYSDYFGSSVASVGDLDGNGVADLAVGADGDDDGGDSKGAVWILFLNQFIYSDFDNDQLPDSWESLYGLDISLNDSVMDPDNDGYTNLVEYLSKTNPFDADTDDDGISDGDEDKNHNSSLDTGETYATRMDSDDDGLQDGTEKGVTKGTSGTDMNIFIPDSDPTTTTDPTDPDTDNDGLKDGEEDINHNGRVDVGETNPGSIQQGGGGGTSSSTGGGGGGGGGGGIFGEIDIGDVIGYHPDGVTSQGTGIYMPVTNGFKALKGAQTHIETFAPFLAKVIRRGFESLERIGEANKGGLLYRIGTYLFPVLGKVAEFYLDAVDSEDLMTDAYSDTMIDVSEFNEQHERGIAISPHVVTGKGGQP